MKIDPAVYRALSLNPEKTAVSSYGGSDFSSTAKISTSLEDGSEKHYFMKSGRGRAAIAMFKGEHASLNAIHNAVPSLCPSSLVTGAFGDGSGGFLVTDFLDMNARTLNSVKRGPEMSLAAKLAKLHSAPAPVPEGFSKPMFGFGCITCCGDTEQPNCFMESWADFYSKNRLLPILTKSERANGKNTILRRLVEETVTEIVPRLIGDSHLNAGQGVTPVVVHGDLWSGNKGRGVVGGNGAIEEVVFDPSSCYAHSEYEFGIMQMFGGFGGQFLQEYHSICPKTEPVDEYEDRIKLYEL